MKNIILIIILTVFILTGCEHNGVTTQPTAELYQFNAVNGIHVYEDIITGNLVYQEDGHGYLLIINKKDLTEEQISSLKQHGYK